MFGLRSMTSHRPQVVRTLTESPTGQRDRQGYKKTYRPNDAAVDVPAYGLQWRETSIRRTTRTIPGRYQVFLLTQNHKRMALTNRNHCSCKTFTDFGEVWHVVHMRSLKIPCFLHDTKPQAHTQAVFAGLLHSHDAVWDPLCSPCPRPDHEGKAVPCERQDLLESCYTRLCH